jgi:hypothetical protein
MVLFSQENSTDDRVRSHVSGMSPKLRETAKLIVLQAWFDDSGKEGIAQSPVYLLAGYSARVKIWESFSEEWQQELDREPKLAYLHAVDAYSFKKEFGHKSRWAEKWGHMNRSARDERLLKFAAIIIKHLKQDAGLGVTWMIRHEDYTHFSHILAQHPEITPKERALIKNPYFLSFQKVIGQMLKIQADKPSEEKIQILFDEGIDDPENLRIGFEQFVLMLNFSSPRHLRFMVNKSAEFRDDKDHPPLQAADLTAWHLRRFCYEVARGKRHDDPVWELLGSPQIRYLNMRYRDEDWLRILEDVRDREIRLEGGKILRLGRKPT